MTREQAEKLAQAIMDRSTSCEREVIAVGMNLYGHPIAAAALIGPDSVQIQHRLSADITLDANMN